MLNSGGTIALTEFLNAHEHIQLHYMIPKSIGLQYAHHVKTRYVG